MIDGTTLNGLVTAVGWTLIHFIWQGAVLGALFFGAMSLMSGASANARYRAGMTCLVAMLAAAVATFCVYHGAAPGTAAIPGPVTGTLVTAETSALAGFWAGMVPHVQQWLPWAVLAWLSGVLLISGGMALDYLRVRKLAVEGVRPLQPGVQAVVDRLLVSLAIPFVVRVLETTRVTVPMVIGCLRPVVLVPPSALMGLSPAQLELIISHELAHVKRLDYLFNLVQIVIETLLFYHPMVRAVSIRVRQERENCCDDLVVAETGDSLAYARALTEVEGLRCSSGMQLTLAATGGQLMGRVRRLVAAPAEQRGAVDWAGGLVILAISIVVALSGASLVSDDPVAQDRRVADAAMTVAEVLAPPENRAPMLEVAAPRPVSATPAPEAVPPPRAAEAPPSSAVPPRGEIETVHAPADSARWPEVPKNATGTPVPVDARSLASTPDGPPAPAGIQEVGPPPAPPAPPAPANRPPAPDSTTPTAPVDAAGTPAPASPPRAPVGAASAETTTPSHEPARVAPERISGGRLVKARQPAYPRRARISGIVGVVTVSFDVTEAGRLEDVTVVDSTSPMFEGPVLKALKKWRYEPFLLDNEPVRARVSHTFQFELEAGQAPLAEDSGRCRKITGSRLCRPRPAYDDLGVVIVYNSALD